MIAAKTSVLNMWFDFAGWQGGTLADAQAAFLALPVDRMDAFCGKLVSSLDALTDVRNAGWFMHARVDAAGIVVSGVRR